MAVLVPLAAFGFVFLTCARRSETGRPGRRRGAFISAFLSAAVVWGVAVVGLTELLSALRLLSFGWLLGLWGLGSIVAAGFLVSGFWFLVGGRNEVCGFSFLVPGRRDVPRTGNHKPQTRPGFDSLMIGWLVLQAAIVDLIALLAPPNTWDSMTYHLGRVVHWMQNQSVAHYPTSIPRQLSLNPWAELAILHLQVLSGGDRLANLVQWFSMVGSLLGVSLIAQQLGADRRGQILAAVVAATIPMGILQASSTQNDYVVGFWLVCLVFFLLQWRARPTWRHSFGVGASLGLAILTKGTAYAYALPFAVWFGWLAVRSLRWRCWQPALVVGAAVLLLNAGHYARNLDLFGSPMGTDLDAYRNASFSAAGLVSNVVRNAALHLGTPVDEVNQVTERGILLLHALLGVDVDDPRLSWNGDFHVLKTSRHEDGAGNLLHLLLALLAGAIFLASRRLRAHRPMGAYLLAAVGAFLIFNAVFKWQPWNSRLHLPIFLLLAPFAATVLATLFRPRMVNVAMALLILASTPWVFYNKSRPLIGGGSVLFAERTDQLFSNRPLLKAPYLEAVGAVRARSCSAVGLDLMDDDWEYPIWVLLREEGGGQGSGVREEGGRPARIEHVDVRNPSARAAGAAPLGPFRPCAIISTRSRGETLVFQGDVYLRVWASERLAVFARRSESLSAEVPPSVPPSAGGRQNGSLPADGEGWGGVLG